MKKYLLGRILRSLLSVFLVTTLIYILIYALVPRKNVFIQDTNYNKMAAEPDKKINYENLTFRKLGYIEYLDSKELKEATSEFNNSVTLDDTEENRKIYTDYLSTLGKTWKLEQFPKSKGFYATREIPILERVVRFYGKLIKVDHPWKIKDPENPNLERYIKFASDPAVGPAIVGSGTEHKYLLYFNGEFPFVHQNFLNLDLGISFPTYANLPVIQIITQSQGRKDLKTVTFPTGVKQKSAVDIYSRTYKNPETMDRFTKEQFGENDPYTATLTNQKDPSMITSSAIIGIIGIVLTYVIGIPLGVCMARFKHTLFDTTTTGGLTFLSAIPSIALVYVVRFLGSKIGFPDAFPIFGASDIRSYVMPSLILAILSIPSLAIWVRRYMIDQQLSDYVRFARAKGLSEKEISNNHIFKNATIPILVSIPGAILGTIVGATFTEMVFAYPGMGKMLIDAVNATNNNMIVGLAFIFSVLGIVSALIADILMTVLDPRIKLSDKGGK